MTLCILAMLQGRPHAHKYLANTNGLNAFCFVLVVFCFLEREEKKNHDVGYVREARSVRSWRRGRSIIKIYCIKIFLIKKK